LTTWKWYLKHLLKTQFILSAKNFGSLAKSKTAFTFHEKQKRYYSVENESEFIRECFMDRIYKNEIKRQEDEISDL
jgi:hypothetical protein